MNFLRSIVFFCWTVASLLVLAPALLITAPFVREDRLWWWFAVPYLKGVIGVARHLGGIDYAIRGRENLPPQGGSQRVILCSKHQSTWETFFYPLIVSHPLAYVFKKELLQIPLFGWALGRLGMVHIDRSKGSEAWQRVAEQGARLMDRGKWIIMFPEGTRSARGEQGVYKTGVARLAAATGAVIIPIAVTSGRCWPRRSFLLNPGTIEVSIGPPIRVENRQVPAIMAEVQGWIEGEMRRLDAEAYSPEEGDAATL